MNYNKEQLISMAVQGVIAPPMRFGAFEVDARGQAHAVPSVGGITYNVKVGDSAFGLKCDHIEPGVSAAYDVKTRKGREADAFQFLSCVGNEARVISGDAKGAVGTVIGHHGGVEHVIIDFDDDTLDKLTYQDKVLIKAYGQGLTIEGSDSVKVYNLDPKLLEVWKIKQSSGGVLEVPVVLEVPAGIMGSGIGHPDPATGDYDITTQDPRVVEKYQLDKLCFGDFVAIKDADNTFGRHYYEGAMTIGIVIHSDSILSGHGPGVTTIMSSVQDQIKPVVSSDANLAKMLGIGSHRKS